MRKHWLVLALLLAYSWILDAQRNNIWYFGRKAGLNFNQPVPIPLVNSAMNADEGSSTICDINGNLLFYTNGVTVYNRNHQIMLNGENLAGQLTVGVPGDAVVRLGRVELRKIQVLARSALARQPQVRAAQRWRHLRVQ